MKAICKANIQRVFLTDKQMVDILIFPQNFVYVSEEYAFVQVEHMTYVHGYYLYNLYPSFLGVQAPCIITMFLPI